jgi:hypothetical protein
MANTGSPIKEQAVLLPASIFVRQFIDGNEDMTYSVRLMLDSKAAAFKEPGSSLCNREEFRAG